jgi:hypothetical protein
MSRNGQPVRSELAYAALSAAALLPNVLAGSGTQDWQPRFSLRRLPSGYW